MHIHGESSRSNRVILPMTFENQSLSHFPHRQQQQKQDCYRARFFYRLRQKKKQGRLQHGPLPIRNDCLRNDKQVKWNGQEQHIQSKVITAIVGSSIARNISVKSIESELDEVRLRFKSGSDCTDGLAYLQSSDGQYFMRGVHQLIFIIGTNDLHRVGAFETVQRIDRTVARDRHLYPGVNIVWQLLQQRTRKTWLLPEGQQVLNEIEISNRYLVELTTTKKFDTIQPAIPIQYMYDGLHPSKYGVEMIEETIRNQLQKQKMVYSFSHSTNPCCFQGYASPPPLMSIKL